jgi:hypothetical protein
LVRAGTVALVAFGTLGLALASDDFSAIARRVFPHGG